MAEEKTEETERDINTFRRDENERPTLRLGGVHGKLWGAIREGAQQLRLLGVEPFTSGYKSILSMINIMPIHVPIEANDRKMETTTLPQILNTGGRPSMITLRYDVIPKGVVKVFFTFPDQMQEPVKMLISHLQNMALLNKRRATVKVLDIKEVENTQL